MLFRHCCWCGRGLTLVSDARAIITNTYTSLTVPIRVLDANGISIVADFFVGLTRWQTDWQTDRRRYSVGNNRRSARWRSQILLLSKATTSIYCSSRLDRSDQLQQSAAIFSCKTWRVAVYVNDTLQYSLKESVSHRRTREVTQLFTYLMTHKLFSSCIRRYLVSRACNRVMPALSAVLLSVSNPVCFSSHWPSFALFYLIWRRNQATMYVRYAVS